VELINVKLQKSNIIRSDGGINYDLVYYLASGIVTPFLQVVALEVGNPFESLWHIHDVLHTLHRSESPESCYSFLSFVYDMYGGIKPELLDLARSHKELSNHLMYEIITEMEELIPQILDE